MICIPCMLKKAILHHSHPEPGEKPDRRHITAQNDTPSRWKHAESERTEPPEQAGPSKSFPARRLRSEDLTVAEQANLRNAFDTLQAVRASSTKNVDHAHLYEGLLGKSTALGRDVLLQAAERVATEEATSDGPSERGSGDWA